MQTHADEPRTDRTRMKLRARSQADVSALAGHTALQSLVLDADELKSVDLSPLASCAALQEIDLDGSSLEGIGLSPLASCTSLRKLKLVGRSLRSIDLSPLASCTALQKLALYADGLQSIDLSPLTSCTTFQSLVLSVNRPEGIDLSPLTSCTTLQSLELYVNGSQSIDLSPLASCTRLQSLVLSVIRSQGIDLSPLASCTTLQGVVLRGISLQSIDLSPLASCTALQELRLIRVGLESIDLSPLASCTALQSLELDGSSLRSIDLSPLASCTALQSLELDGSSLRSIDLSPLASCSRLRYLEALGEAALERVEGKGSASLVWCIHLRNIHVGSARRRSYAVESPPHHPSRWSEFRKSVDTVRPSVYHSNVVLYMLGISDLGFVDADLFSVFRSVPKTATLDRAKRVIREALIPYVCAQIDRGGTTIGLDIESVPTEYPEIARRVPRVLELRRSEIESVSVDAEKPDLQRLWLTAYGFEVLNELRRGGAKDLGSPVQRIDTRTRTALSKIGVRLRTAGEEAPAATADGGTVMSEDMRDYILDWARDERGYQPRAPP